jgi:hypothetical protein
MVNVQEREVCLSGQMFLYIARQQRTKKMLARNHMICYLCGLPSAIIELCILCVVHAEAI